MKWLLALPALLFLLLACSQPPASLQSTTPVAPESATAVGQPAASVGQPQATAGALPPTFTPSVSSLPSPTPLPLGPTPTPRPTNTPIAFGDTSVTLRYTIPALGLDRRLVANVAAQITVIDETTQQAVQRSNQPNVLLELRQLLSELVLQPLPVDCQRCVYLEYDMPSVPATGAGWLQDTVMLASLENYTTVALGPHFPPDTVVGLRRAASPYAPAHALALTADGRLWRWLATDGEILEPLSPATVGSGLAAAASALLAVEPADSYQIDCVRLPGETLYLAREEAEPLRIDIRCPALALPTTIQPLYVQLDAWLAPLLAPVAIPQPPAALPLTALLDYRRPDDVRLTVAADGTAVAQTATDTYTGTLSADTLTTLTTDLLATEALQPGLATLRSEDTDGYRLLLRGPDGVLDGQWSDAAAFPLLVELDQLLAELLPADEAAPTETPPPAEPDETEPAPTATPSE